MQLGVVNEETWAFFDDIYQELAAQHDVTTYVRPQYSLPLFNTRLNALLFQRTLQRFLDQNDAVFFEWASGCLAQASRMPKRAAIVTRLHRYEMYRWADRINWDAVDRIVLVSEAKRREFVTRFPEQSAKLVVIPEAISLDRFRPTNKPAAGNIGILCHLRPRKRVYELILVFAELCKQRDDLRLHIGGGEAAGFEEYHEAIHALVHRLKLTDRVIFYDHVADPVRWYSEIDLFVSNSYSEGLQVSPMEAIASGCFCLSHHWDGADELLPVEQLFMTDQELIERILDYCDLPAEEQERRRMRQRQRVCEQFDMDRIKVRIREVIEEVVSAR